jgi:hypothetical protein
MVPTMRRSRIGTFGNCGALQDRDDTGLADALPRQAEHEGVELRVGQRECGAAITRPDELAAVQSARREPYADAVVHEHLHAIGAAVGEQVGVVWPRGAEDTDHARQCSFGAGTHVQRRHGQPHQLNLDHELGSPQQLARPGREVGRGRARPDNFHRHRATAQLDFDVAAVRSRQRRRRSDRHRHEPAWLGGCRLTAFASQLPPAVHDVGVDAVRHCHLGYRGAGHLALGQHLQLALLVVAPPPYHPLVACHRVHVEFRGHDPSPQRGSNQDGLAGRIQRNRIAA